MDRDGPEERGESDKLELASTVARFSAETLGRGRPTGRRGGGCRVLWLRAGSRAANCNSEFEPQRKLPCLVDWGGIISIGPDKLRLSKS